MLYIAPNSFIYRQLRFFTLNIAFNIAGLDNYCIFAYPKSSSNSNRVVI